MVNRKYKDRLFTKIFSNKKDLLSLYNAINNSEYDNEEELEINTLEDAVYMGMKNDISYILGDVLGLTEQQSTWNPNMPLRGLLYYSSLYKGIIGKSKDIYSSEMINLPTPQFLVFYNGIKDIEDHVVLRLSDAFINKRVEPCLECVAHVFNINHGRNKELMAKCRKLEEYSIFISRIREGKMKNLTIEEAVAYAIDSCIENHILEDVLSKNREEVQDMVLTEYNEQLHIENEKHIAEKKAEQKWQKIVDEKAEQINEQTKLLNEQTKQLNEQTKQLNEQEELLNDKDKEIAMLKQQLQELIGK